MVTKLQPVWILVKSLGHYRLKSLMESGGPKVAVADWIREGKTLSGGDSWEMHEQWKQSRLMQTHSGHTFFQRILWTFFFFAKQPRMLCLVYLRMLFFIFVSLNRTMWPTTHVMFLHFVSSWGAKRLSVPFLGRLVTWENSVKNWLHLEESTRD